MFCETDIPGLPDLSPEKFRQHLNSSLATSLSLINEVIQGVSREKMKSLSYLIESTESSIEKLSSLSKQRTSSTARLEALTIRIVQLRSEISLTISPTSDLRRNMKDSLKRLSRECDNLDLKLSLAISKLMLYQS
jgi:hypothetical protein